MTHVDTAREMHPTRWGDPAAAGPLPEAARGLVELAFGPPAPTVPTVRVGRPGAARVRRR